MAGFIYYLYFNFSTASFFVFVFICRKFIRTFSVQFGLKMATNFFFFLNRLIFLKSHLTSKDFFK